MKKIVMGLSGGMDSATLLGYLCWADMALELDLEEIYCCTFSYGSKHGVWENRAAQEIVKYHQDARVTCKVTGVQMDISRVMEQFKSNLLLTGGEIPEGHYEEESMTQTVVPGRNMIFASIMAGLAESIGAYQVALGVHSGDHHIYPDCRAEFIKALDAAVYLSSDRKVEIFAPLIDENKTSILEMGYEFDPPVPYHLTRTCYKDQPLACGRCGSCSERLEAFEKIGKKDPVQYEEM